MQAGTVKCNILIAERKSWVSENTCLEFDTTLNYPLERKDKYRLPQIKA